ncbi:hypothetical protein D3C86_2240820 [compost metagenome]
MMVLPKRKASLCRYGTREATQASFAAFRVSSLGLARNASTAVCRVLAVLSESLYTA